MALLQGLDLAPYLSEAGSLENTGPCTYDLAGVCAHDGKSVNCGHYRAVCRRGLALSSCSIIDKHFGVLRVALYRAVQTQMSNMQGSNITSHRGSDRYGLDTVVQPCIHGCNCYQLRALWRSTLGMIQSVWAPNIRP